MRMSFIEFATWILDSFNILLWEFYNHSLIDCLIPPLPLYIPITLTFLSCFPNQSMLLKIILDNLIIIGS